MARCGRHQPCFSPPRRPVIGILINAKIGLNTEFLIRSSQSLNFFVCFTHFILITCFVALATKKNKRKETLLKHDRPRGPTDKASDYESGDSRFESWRGRFFFKRFIASGTNIFFSNPLYPRPPNRL